MAMGQSHDNDLGFAQGHCRGHGEWPSRMALAHWALALAMAEAMAAAMAHGHRAWPRPMARAVAKKAMANQGHGHGHSQYGHSLGHVPMARAVATARTMAVGIHSGGRGRGLCLGCRGASCRQSVGV